MNGLRDSSHALTLARAVIEYFTDQSQGKYQHRDDAEYVKRWAYRVQQEEEMKLWNL